MIQKIPFGKRHRDFLFAKFYDIMQKIFGKNFHEKIFKICNACACIDFDSAKIFANAVEENREYFPPILMYHDIREMPLNYRTFK